jgi:hypothetical protein
MNKKEFIKVYKQAEAGKPYHDNGYDKFCVRLEELAEPEHVHEWAKGFSDKIICSCGWTSSGYDDGACWAYDEWLKHVVDQCSEEFLIRIYIQKANGEKDRFTRYSECDVMINAHWPNPLFTQEEMQSVIFAAKNAMIKLIQNRKSNKDK